MSSTKATKKCRCCRGQLTIERPNYLTFGVTKTICDDCFKTFKAGQMKYDQFHAPCCRRCKKENMGFGYIFKNKMFCLDCMCYDNAWSEIFDRCWATCIDCIYNYIDETPVEN